MDLHVVMDGLDEGGHTGECALADTISGELSEPAFDEVQPRCRCGREVEMEALVSAKPHDDVRVFVVA